MSFQINLPAIDGSVNCGLAATSDCSLVAGLRLKINKLGDRNGVSHALASAHSIASTHFSNSPDARRILLCAAYVVTMGSLVVEVDGRFDCDVVEGAETCETETSRTISETLTDSNIMQAALIVFSTKVSFWLTNHHTGGAKLVGYTKKIKDAVIPTLPDDTATKLFHTVGHWASTHICLKMLGVNNIRNVSRTFPEVRLSIVFTDDVKLRVMSMPAGTHKLGVCYEVIKRLVRHPLVRVFPGVGGLAAVVIDARAVLAEPAFYHVGAAYLTGEPRRELTLDAYPIGSLGTFVRSIYPKSSILKSPSITRGTMETFKEHESYNADFDTVCRNFVSHSATQVNAVDLTALVPKLGELHSDELIANILGIPVVPRRV